MGNKKRLRLEWAVTKAIYRYVLEEEKMTSNGEGFRASMQWHRVHSSDDIEWAKRTAEQFKIELPVPKGES